MKDHTVLELVACNQARPGLFPKEDWFSQHGQSNVISICSLDKGYHSKRWNPLSIKTMLKGSLIYETSDSVYTVSKTKFLLLNNDREYQVYVPQNQKEIDEDIVSITINFSPEFCGLVTSSFESGIETKGSWITCPEFFENTHAYSSLFDRYLNSISPLLDDFEQNKETLNYRLYDLFCSLLHVQHKIGNSIEGISAVKHSTKLELFKRLHILKDYIDSCYARDISLNTLAELAALNPYYLLRIFKQYFNTTPHQYITARRIEEAKALLNRSQTVSEVCRKVGFEDIASFSKLFKRHTGVSPSLYPKQKVATS